MFEAQKSQGPYVLGWVLLRVGNNTINVLPELGRQLVHHYTVFELQYHITYGYSQETGIDCKGRLPIRPS